MKIYCNTGKKGWSTYYDAFFLKQHLKDFQFILKSTMKPPEDKNAIILFTDPGAWCLMAKDYSRHKNVIVCWWHGDSSTQNIGVQRRIPVAKKFINQCKFVIVSCDQGYKSVIKLGVKRDKIIKIPLGVEMSIFQIRNKSSLRKKYSIPQDSFVVGSFQRDTDKRGGPKWIKGPDVIAESLNLAKNSIKNLFVLLSGPRRSYIVKKLQSYDISIKHIEIEDFVSMPEIYNCLDCYLIGSRVEGGPKAIMESLSCGVPVVSTKCGMAEDVINDSNGYLCNIDDIESLSDSLINVSKKKYNDLVLRNSVLDFDYGQISEQYRSVFKRCLIDK